MPRSALHTAFLLGALVPGLLGPLVAQGPVGSLTGSVRDRGAMTSLAGARVTVVGTDLTVITDAAGTFRFEQVPVGTYALEVRTIGYRPRIVTDVVVRSRRTTEVAIQLEPLVFELEAVVVRPSYFADSEEQTVATPSFSFEEIRRAPGSAGDVSRIIMSLPSVAKVNDQSNALIVRGGSPIENGFLVDNIAIPNINHFPTQGASGGPIGILNVDLIREVEFHAGGFPVEYGDRLAAVMDVALREGTRAGVEGQVDLGMAGVGGGIEGPLPVGNGSFVATARRSYVDLVVKWFDVGSTVAPRYGDYQGKVSLNLSASHKLSAVAVWADDHSEADLQVARDNAMGYHGRQDMLQGTTGVNWWALWGDGVYSNTSLAYTHSAFDEDNYETASAQLLVRNRSTEGELKLRNVSQLRLGTRTRLRFGVEASLLDADYDNLYGSRLGRLGDSLPEVRVAREISGGRVGMFTSLTTMPTARLTASVGLRADHFTPTGNTGLSPRGSVAYRLGPRTTVNAAVGLYRQGLPSVFLAHAEANRDLRDTEAVHYVLGVTQLLTDDTRLTVEAYRKDYRHFPVDPDRPAFFPVDELYYDLGILTPHTTLTDAGRARSTGVEVMVQKKLARNVYGLASASYFRSRYSGADGLWRDRVFDNRFIFAAEGGYKPGGSWEVSGRWIYAGGAPYTPIDEATSLAAGNTVLDGARINQARYPAYHSLNLRVDRRFHFSGSTLIAYLSVWNAYDRRNVASYYWNVDEDRVDSIRQWGMLPILGIEYEF
jgi:hypothetical protein